MAGNILPDIHAVKNQIFGKIWELVDSKYVLFKERNVNWDSIRLHYEKRLDRIESYQGLYDWIDQMLLELGDPHTRIVFSPHNSSLGAMSLLLVYIEGNYYIYKNLEDNQLSTGMLLLSINDIPIKEAESRVLDKLKFVSKSAGKTTFIKEFSRGGLGHCLKIKALSDSGKVVEEDIHFQSVNRHSFNASDIERAKASLSLCQVKEFDSNIGYIKILNFRNKRAAADFTEAISKLYTKKSLIIDIRGNEGGLIEEAAAVAAILSKRKMRIGYKLQRKEGGKRDEFGEPIEIIINSTDVQLSFEKIIILCDEFTMSSAEFIFLKALKGLKDKVLAVGKKTAGLAHGASVFTLFDGTRVQVTTSKYLNTEGNIVEEEGIEPDFEVHNTEKVLLKNIDDQLDYALNLCKN